MAIIQILIAIQQINDFMNCTKYETNSKIDYRNVSSKDNTLKSIDIGFDILIRCIYELLVTKS